MPATRHKPQATTSGFTLLELSIVLVVIALLVGAITVGATILRNAQLQSIISDVNRFKNATLMFRDKYKYLPGDMPTATAIWGTASACPNGSADDKQNIATCNGDGDGFIAGQGTPAISADSGNNEQYLVWQHLSDAGLIEGQYTGTYMQSGNVWQAGGNTPVGQFSKIGIYSLTYAAPVQTTYSDAWAGPYGHIMSYGQYYTTGHLAQAPVMLDTDAAGIDTKIDDGMPATGNVMSFPKNYAADPNCTTATAVTATYQSAGTSNNCALIFLMGF